MPLETIGSPLLWAGFIAFVLAMLAIDLGVFHRKAITKFTYLKVGLSVVLIFVGAKMLLMDVYKVPIAASLGIIAGILGLSIVASLLRPASATPAAPGTSSPPVGS